jgi:glycerophosphoryl diester phosphodiesterase
VKLRTILYLSLTATIISVSAINASWLASPPDGALKLIATDTKAGCPSRSDLERSLGYGAEYVMITADCPALSYAIERLPKRKLMIGVANSAELDATLRQFPAKNAKFTEQYGILANDTAIADVRAKAPALWGWTKTEGRACFDAYLTQGWAGIVPAVCENGTMLIGLDERWKIWGWPNRFQARMAAANVNVVIADNAGGSFTGLTQLDQIPLIPRDFKGYALVDDIKLIGPAIR